MEMNVETLNISRVFHPAVLKEVGLEVALAFLEVAREFRSGVIPPDEFDMTLYHCGTSHCIAGWVDKKMGRSYKDLFYGGKLFGGHGPAHAILDRNGWITPPLGNLFSTFNPSDPQWAADAIEEYLYNYAADPWKAAAARRAQ